MFDNRLRRNSWARHATVDTLVDLMGVTHRAHIADKLIAAGRPASQPAAFIERGTTPDERIATTTLGAIAAGKVNVESPAVLVVGGVVTIRERLQLGSLSQPRSSSQSCSPSRGA
ncbi:MAG: SAM-dependent methyltransferase [Acidimicrobiia bacterium]